MTEAQAPNYLIVHLCGEHDSFYAGYPLESLLVTAQNRWRQLMSGKSAQEVPYSRTHITNPYSPDFLVEGLVGLNLTPGEQEDLGNAGFVTVDRDPWTEMAVETHAEIASLSVYEDMNLEIEIVPRFASQVYKRQIMNLAHTGTEVWHDDLLQFSRLISEIVAVHEIDTLALGQSMDLTTHEVEELIFRADRRWESLKAKIVS